MLDIHSDVHHNRVGQDLFRAYPEVWDRAMAVNPRWGYADVSIYLSFVNLRLWQKVSDSVTAFMGGK